MTNAPRIICPTTNADAIIDAIFVDVEVSFDLKVKNMVTKTIMPVVAAIVRWKYSMINSFIGTRPAGQRGQSGQLSPTPDELTYPPINIRANIIDNVEKEIFVRSILFYIYYLCSYIMLFYESNSTFNFMTTVLQVFQSCMDELCNGMDILLG